MKQQTKKSVTRLNPDQTIALGKKTYTCLSENKVVLGLSDETLAALKASVDKAEQSKGNSELAYGAYKESQEVAKADIELLKKDLKAMGNTVDSVAKGDPSILSLSGFDLTSPTTHKSEVHLITKISAKITDRPGEVTYNWEPDKGASAYLVRMAEEVDSADSWNILGSVTKSCYTATGLNSGKKMLFEVCPIGPSGQGPWSNPVAKIVP